MLHEITTNTKLKDGIWKNSDLKTSIVRLYKGIQSWARVPEMLSRLASVCIFPSPVFASTKPLLHRMREDAKMFTSAQL